MSKIIQNKMLCVYLHIYRVHKVVSAKTGLLCSRYEKIKFGIKIRHFSRYVLSFYTRHKKSVFSETLCAHIKCGDVHAIFFLDFLTFEICFLDEGIMRMRLKCISETWLFGSHVSTMLCTIDVDKSSNNLTK